MSEEKKYSAKEAAIAVLQKAEEILKKSEALKKSAAPVTKSEEIPQKASDEKDATPSDDVESQKAPQDNPAEQKEGNNPPAGDPPGAQANMGQPGLKGHLKLAKFIGYCHAKRKKPAAPQGAM